MDFELSPAQKELQARARALAETHMAPRAAEIDRTEAYPWDHVERLRAAGLIGMTIAKELGGQGLGHLEAVLVIEEMAKHCGPSAPSSNTAHPRSASSRPIWFCRATSRPSASPSPGPAAPQPI